MALCEVALSDNSDFLAEEMNIGMVNRYFCQSLVKVKSISTLMVVPRCLPYFKT